MHYLKIIKTLVNENLALLSANIYSIIMPSIRENGNKKIDQGKSIFRL